MPELAEWQDPRTRDWVEDVSGASIRSGRRASSGGSRETYLLDMVTPDGTSLPLVLRMEEGGSFTGTEISVGKEAVVYRALAATKVPVPRVLGVAPGARPS